MIDKALHPCLGKELPPPQKKKQIHPVAVPQTLSTWAVVSTHVYSAVVCSWRCSRSNAGSFWPMRRWYHCIHVVTCC